MALIVEDGTGMATAESYASEIEADLYHEKRGNTSWDSVTDKEAALRKATDYLLQTYSHLWKGARMTSTQALDWPRGNVYAMPFMGSVSEQSLLVDDDIVPVQVKNACIELALKSVSNDLNPDLTKDIITQTVGPISTTYSASSPQKKRYTAIDMMLRPYLSSSGSNINGSVVRS